MKNDIDSLTPRYSNIPGIIKYRKWTVIRSSMSSSSKNSNVHTVTGYNRWRKCRLLSICTPYTQKKLGFLISTINNQTNWLEINSSKGLNKFHNITSCSTAYLIKRTESPAISLFELTNTLHPVVSKCLFGWPEMKRTCIKHSWYCICHMEKDLIIDVNTYTCQKSTMRLLQLICQFRKFKKLDPKLRWHKHPRIH